MVEKQLPLYSLNLFGSQFLRRSGAAPARLTEVNKLEWIPILLQGKRDSPGLRNFLSRLPEGGENGVGSDAPEPIGGVPCIGLAAMQNAMPKTAVRIVDILANGVRFVKAGEV